MTTGANSMIGKEVADYLDKKGAVVDRVFHGECNLIQPEDVGERFDSFKPEYVIHAAGFNGGINFNKEYPASIYYRTVQMGINVLTACVLHDVKKVVSILPSCAYSYQDKYGGLRDNLFEEDFADGPPHPSVACHGLAKRTLFDYSHQIYKQFKLNYVCVVLNNCMGPRDNFDPDKTKVVGALIKKFVDAKRTGAKHVEVFGTGAARREFLYSQDAAEGIVRALEVYDDPTLPINLGGGTELTIKELAEKIKCLVGYDGDIKFLTDYPDGQLRKRLWDGRTKDLLDWQPSVDIDTALRNTIKYYEEKY